MENNVIEKLQYHLYWNGFNKKLSWIYKNYCFDINDYKDLLLTVKNISSPVSQQVVFLLLKLIILTVYIVYETKIYHIPLNISQKECDEYCVNLRNTIENIRKWDNQKTGDSITLKLKNHLNGWGFIWKLIWKKHFFDIHDYNELLATIKKIKTPVPQDISFLLLQLVNKILTIVYEKELYNIPFINVTTEELYDYSFELRDTVEKIWEDEVQHKR